jgi:hypothetical protein
MQIITRFAVGAVAISMIGTALAQQVIVYPARGQNQQQQNMDTADCQLWAKQNTGVDPVMVAQAMSNQPPPPPPQQEAGAGARGALRGAAVGGIIGGIGGRGGEGAAAGAVVGGLAARRNQQQQQQAQQQQYAQQQQAQQQQAAGAMATFNRAFAACMQGRGYTVN